MSASHRHLVRANLLARYPGVASPECQCASPPRIASLFWSLVFSFQFLDYGHVVGPANGYATPRKESTHEEISEKLTGTVRSRMLGCMIARAEIGAVGALRNLYTMPETSEISGCDRAAGEGS